MKTTWIPVLCLIDSRMRRSELFMGPSDNIEKKNTMVGVNEKRQIQKIATEGYVMKDHQPHRKRSWAYWRAT